MQRHQEIITRIAEELTRRQQEVNDPTLTGLSVTIRIDARTHHASRLILRPEYERSLNGARASS